MKEKVSDFLKNALTAVHEQTNTVQFELLKISQKTKNEEHSGYCPTWN